MWCCMVVLLFLGLDGVEGVGDELLEWDWFDAEVTERGFGADSGCVFGDDAVGSVGFGEVSPVGVEGLD